MINKKLFTAAIFTASISGLALANERVSQFEFQHGQLIDHHMAPFLIFDNVTEGEITVTESFDNPEPELSDLTLAFNSIPSVTFEKLTFKTNGKWQCQNGSNYGYYEGKAANTWAFQEVIAFVCPEFFSPNDMSFNVTLAFATGESFIDLQSPEQQFLPLAELNAPALNVSPNPVVDTFDTEFLGKELKLSLLKNFGEVVGPYQMQSGFLVNAQWMGQQDKTMVIPMQYPSPFTTAIGFDIIEDPMLPEFDQIQISIRYLDDTGMLQMTPLAPLFPLMDEQYGPLDLPAPPMP